MPPAPDNHHAAPAQHRGRRPGALTTPPKIYVSQFYYLLFSFCCHPAEPACAVRHRTAVIRASAGFFVYYFHFFHTNDDTFCSFYYKTILQTSYSKNDTSLYSYIPRSHIYVLQYLHQRRKENLELDLRASYSR